MNDRNEFNRQVIEEFRANAGKVGGAFDGASVLLLTTTGARSGVKRTTPLVYRENGANYIVIASKGGAPTNPDWYHNLLANPEVTVEVGVETLQATARVTIADERDSLYAAHEAAMPQFAEYRQKTTRTIPVVSLEPK